MQQLYLIAKQRYTNLLEINNNLSIITSQKYRSMREQEKQRCEKQAWVLSMLRAKKKQITPELKKGYYKYSYEIMKIMDADFSINSKLSSGNQLGSDTKLMEQIENDENFLNTMVCLYTKFFELFQQKLSFKVKVKNLLRPTNHNVINDLIKYLVDFSRDYCQYLIYLKMKAIEKSQSDKIQKEEEQNYQGGPNFNNKKIISGKKSISTVSELATSGGLESSTRMVREESQIPEITKKNPISSLSVHMSGSVQQNQQTQESSLNSRKKQMQKLYKLLNIQNFSNFVLMEKSKSNLDVIKLKMNQMYRDIKFRNNMVKSSIQQYYNQYNPNKNPKQCLLDDNTNISYPIKVCVAIQKNGFSCLNLFLANDKTEKSISPVKQRNRVQSLANKETSINKSGIKNQLLLSSLKVIKVSENPLPPLKQPYDNDYRKSSTKLVHKFSNLPISLQNIQTRLIKNTRVNTAVENQKDKPSSNKDGQGNEANQYIYYNYNSSYNQELARQAERKRQQKKKISDMRRHFTSQQKMKNSKKKMNDPEDKLIEWLDKINLMKQLQRKKIMGLT